MRIIGVACSAAVLILYWLKWRFSRTKPSPSNIEAFHYERNEENERCPVTTEQVVIREPVAAPTNVPPSELRGNERCIAGQLFRRDGNAWSNVGRC